MPASSSPSRAASSVYLHAILEPRVDKKNDTHHVFLNPRHGEGGGVVYKNLRRKNIVFHF